MSRRKSREHLKLNEHANLVTMHITMVLHIKWTNTELKNNNNNTGQIKYNYKNVYH